MAEPSRKKSKQHGTAVILPFSQATDETSLVFLTTHKTDPCWVDLTEFRDGVIERKGAGAWGGDFSGRPLLIQQFLPHFRAQYSAQTKESVVYALTDLRCYWRLFDECDALPLDQRPKPVQGVAELNDLHDRLQIRNRVGGNATRKFVRLANSARKQLGLTELHWTPIDRKPEGVKVALDMMQTRALYHACKSHVRRIYGRWESDSTLMPSKRDCIFIATFVLIKTGWNEAVALNIDVEDYRRHHMGDLGRHLLHAIKVRAGGTEQVHVGQNKEEWSPGNLVKKMIERSEPLRAMQREKLAQLQRQTIGQRPTTAQTLEFAQLKKTIRSPWLHATNKNSTIENFDPENPAWRITELKPNAFSSGSIIWGLDGASLMEHLQGEANTVLKLRGQPLIEKVTLSDLRDAYINWAYSSTGYEWMMAKLAAGHTSIHAAITYLRTRALKMHGEGAVRKLTDNLFDEIKNRKRLDVVFLYARVNRGSVSEEQRQRWSQGKDRTRVGTGCADFTHPPKHMAPQHQEGKGCRTQRCTLCEHAIVFHDSYHHLARRKAELMDHQDKVGQMIWATTDFWHEMEKLEETLANYDPKFVAKSLDHWQEEIKTGRHIPPTFEGSYE